MLWIEKKAKEPHWTEQNWIDGEVNGSSEIWPKTFWIDSERKKRYLVVYIIMTSIIILSIFMSDRLVLAIDRIGPLILRQGKKLLVLILKIAS